MEFPEKRFLSLTELAAWLGLNQKTVRRKIREGKIPGGKPVTDGGQPLWTRQAAGVAAWILAHSDQFSTPPVKSGKHGKTRETPALDGNLRDVEKP